MGYTGVTMFPDQDLTSTRKLRESRTREHGVQGMKWGQTKHAFGSKGEAQEALSQRGFVQTTKPGIFRAGGAKGQLVRLRPHNTAGTMDTPKDAHVVEPTNGRHNQKWDQDTPTEGKDK